MERVVVKVRCGGGFHRVGLIDGAIALFNHSSLKREMTLVQMGQHCRCLEILHAWQRRQMHLLPPVLRKIREETVRTHSTRECSRHLNSFLALCGHPMAQIRAAESIREAMLPLILAHYRHPPHVVLYIHKIVTGGCMSIQTTARKKSRRYGNTYRASVEQATYKFHIPLSWLWRIYRPGHAIFDGQIVLEAHPLDKNWMETIVVKQTRGYALTCGRRTVRVSAWQKACNPPVKEN